MKSIIAISLLFAITLTFSAGSVFGRPGKAAGTSGGARKVSTASDAAPVEVQAPGMLATVSPGEKVACNSNTNTISLTVAPTTLASVTIKNVGSNDVLVIHTTSQINTTGDGGVGFSVRVLDNNNNVFHADPDTNAFFPFVIQGGEGWNTRAYEAFIDPSSRPGFVLGDVKLFFQVFKTSGTPQASDRMICVEKIDNTPFLAPQGNISD